MRETRLFCNFGDVSKRDSVVRETTWREGTFEELRAAGAPSDPEVYADPERASVALQAVAPIACVKYVNEMMKLQV